VATVTEELKELAALLREGLITRPEFDEQKVTLLAGSRGSSEPPRSSSSPGIPNHVGAYRITGRIGDGGMGTVYRGQHRSSEMAARQGGEVAIKVMHPHIARNAAFAERFEREASLGLKLDHPGICRVYDLVVDGEVLALVMELLVGRPLSDVIGTQTGPIPWSQARPMFEQLLESVSYMHGERVLHRDIKPENVLVTGDGKLKLLDLGIAKDTGSGKTKTGVGMGTVDYMAPEQHTDAGKVDERADVYALGMTLYEMLAGRLPWGDDLDALGVLQQKLSGDIPPPTDFYPDIAPEVVAVLMASLAAERDHRTRSAAAMAVALQQAAAAAEAAVATQAPVVPSAPVEPEAPVVPSAPVEPEAPVTPEASVATAALAEAESPVEPVVPAESPLGRGSPAPRKRTPAVWLVALALVVGCAAVGTYRLYVATPLGQLPTEAAGKEAEQEGTLSDLGDSWAGEGERAKGQKVKMHLERAKGQKVKMASASSEETREQRRAREREERKAERKKARREQREADTSPEESRSRRGGSASSVGVGPDPIILGALDKSIIDRIVKQHLAKIRYCYQKELNKNPKLSGKLVVKFVVAKDGRVSTATTKKSASNLNNKNVEKCVNSRFMRMRFPEPKGGGIAIVAYPLLFNSRGG